MNKSSIAAAMALTMTFISAESAQAAELKVLVGGSMAALASSARSSSAPPVTSSRSVPGLRRN